MFNVSGSQRPSHNQRKVMMTPKLANVNGVCMQISLQKTTGMPGQQWGSTVPWKAARATSVHAFKTSFKLCIKIVSRRLWRVYVHFASRQSLLVISSTGKSWFGIFILAFLFSRKSRQCRSVFGGSVWRRIAFLALSLHFLCVAKKIKIQMSQAHTYTHTHTSRTPNKIIGKGSGRVGFLVTFWRQCRHDMNKTKKGATRQQAARA